MKKEGKIVFILYVTASVLFFVSAILGFIDKSNISVTHFCLGLCFLGLSSEHYKKSEEKQDKGKKN